MKKIALVAMVAATLAGCSGKLANQDICTTPRPLDVTVNADDMRDNPGWQQLNAENCVHRWAYRLAGSSDPANTVAEAVMGACQDTVFRTAYADEQHRKAREEQTDGFDTQTGISMNLYAAAWRELRNKALFHVVQARVGHCKIP